MTALVVLAIIVSVLVIAVSFAVLNARQVRNKALLELCQSQKRLILQIEKEALQYGYPTDPLAYNIVTKIQERREKESQHS